MDCSKKDALETTEATPIFQSGHGTCLHRHRGAKSRQHIRMHLQPESTQWANGLWLPLLE